MFPLFAPVFSLQQIEKNRVDLKKLEEDTKTKIGAVNAQKVAMMVEVMEQIKVWGTKLITTM
jgi:hypothetical protein